ncbi:cathepsin L-like proteinase [Diorhabda sublineata]|uniref:cathepsin L-like proteinase n=1 Tax=Diorhabda sublineata TaxID=1163346 RepID=UPI0024E0AD7C|nr:cathepsin L-like proteinase [Diorhabda sublineata]
MFIKYFLMCAVIMVAYGLTDEEEFANFKNKFQKIYSTPEEEQQRFRIFQSNLRYIKEQNQKFANGEVSSSVGINQFADLSSNEWANRNHGLKPLQ